MARILITGAQSRLGRGLIDLLVKAKEHQLTFLSMKAFQVEEIRKARFPLGLRRFDAVVHFSWPASSFMGNYRSSLENLHARDKTIALGRLCMEEDTWFIGLGSVLDGDSFAGSSLYADAKSEVKRILLREMEGARFTWARPFWVFEPHVWPSFLFPEAGRIPKIEDDRVRDFIHVGDVATAMKAILDDNLEGQIDIGSAVGRSPSSILRAIGQPYKTSSENIEEVSQDFPLARIKALTGAGWSPSHTLRFFQAD